eukprot:gene2235-2546_t
MSTIHCYLRGMQGDIENPTNSVIYGPSTENRIERFWKELLERFEQYFKEQLKKLLEDGHYDKHNKFHRCLMAFVYVPVVQKQLDIFQETILNNQRGRKQRAKMLPCGMPEHIYSFPKRYGARNCAYNVTDAQLEEVAELSAVFESNDDYIDQELRNRCQ